MSTRQQDAAAAVAAYEAMANDPYKAPEQVEEARRVADKALAMSSEHTCDDDDVPFCSRCDAEGP